MSYCRFSCDNFKSDVYIYEDCSGGITVHVASNRIEGDLPHQNIFNKWEGGEITIKEFVKLDSENSAFLDKCNRIPINRKHAGERFNGEPEDAISFIKELISLGYNVPSHVIPVIQEDNAN